MLVVSLRRCELKLHKKTVNHSWGPCIYLLLYRRSKVLTVNALSKSCLRVTAMTKTAILQETAGTRTDCATVRLVEGETIHEKCHVEIQKKLRHRRQ
jgi:hypothetical protein